MGPVAIIGGHGQIALRLARRLADRGVVVRSVIRNPAHREDVRASGGEPVVCDLEETDARRLARALDGCRAVVFAAGAGPGSGAARKETVDHAGAVLTRDATDLAGIRRLLVISAMGTDNPPSGDDVFSVYLRAKARADEAVMASSLDWTILRPGRLSNDPATHRVRLARHVDRGVVTRDDVAEVVRLLLADARAAGRVAELVGGDAPLEPAVDAFLRGAVTDHL